MDKDNLIWIVVGLVALAIVVFLFVRKRDDAGSLPAADDEPALPEKRKEPSKHAEPKEAKGRTAEPLGEKVKAKGPAEAATKVEPLPAPTGKPKKLDKKEDKKREKEEEGDREEAREHPRPPRPGAAPAAPAARRPKDVAGLRRGLAKARDSEGLFGRLKSLFTGKKEIDPQIVDQIEEILLTSDVGVKTTAELVEAIREELSRGELKDEAKVWAALRKKVTEILDFAGPTGGGLALGAQPTVVMVLGVNGVGKTTTIGKLATRLTQQGKKVVLAAGDTFRAAAVHQLQVWGKRAGCEVVSGAEGANAGAVIFDAIQKAKQDGADVVLVDTAGRLHTKANLMDELKKIAKTMGKALDGSPHETLLVLDATNGQNAIQQVALFKEALPLTGIVLTKLDGTAKGGVILGICQEHEIPVRYIGIGERQEDLRDFQADEFVEALLGQGSESSDKAA